MTAIPDQQLITMLFIGASISTMIALISGGVLIYFKKAVLDRIKLKKLMRYGYVICELVRLDKTRSRCILIPDKDNSIHFPGVDGSYILDDASVTLTDRKYPTYTWIEGECAPMNFGKEHIDTKIMCPHCEKETIVKVERLKSINPSVLDNIILKIKTLAQMVGINKMLMYVLILVGVGIIISGIGAFMVVDFKKRIGEILAPKIYEQCSMACGQTANNIIT